MGYRSEWKLAMCGSEIGMAQTLLDILARADQIESNSDEHFVYCMLFGVDYNKLETSYQRKHLTENPNLVKIPGGLGLIFGHDSMKCFDGFDEAMRFITDRAHENGCACAFARLGDHETDNEVGANCDRIDGYTAMVPWTRALREPELTCTHEGGAR